MKKEFRLTQAGIDELKEELVALKQRRANVADKLKTAREQGDLRENAEYHSARDEQAQVESRIAEIEHILRNVELIKSPANKSAVELGNTVTLGGDSGPQTYTIVGSVEADPAQNKISDESPIGQALLGKKVGDSVIIVLPSGERNYKIITIN